MVPDAVLFDLDDTLCRYRRSGSTLLSAAFERTGIEPFIDAEEYYGRYPEFVEASESMADLRERCFAAIAAEKGRDPEPFETALDALSAGANAAGMRSVWLTDAAEKARDSGADHVVSDLESLPGVLFGGESADSSGTGTDTTP